MARILHITDLHGAKLAKRHWNEARRKIGEDSFDFVVISGDLADRGKGDKNRTAQAPDEYRHLHTFLRQDVIKVLRRKKQDPARVVIVPGNHDLDFDVTLGEEVDGQSLGVDHLRAELHKCRRSTESSHFRVCEADKLIRIDQARYNERFAAFQAFLNGFYERSLDDPRHRAFQLDAQSQEHWSAHVFPEDGIAFFGFNSCDCTDRYWAGARVSSDAIACAAAHVKEYAQGLVAVGVWHHGMFAERGRPDYLSVAELGSLKNAGLHLGLHGHTHEHEQINLVDLLEEPFPVIATGSLGAPPTDRPGGVANQFSILEIDRNGVRWELYDLINHRQWKARPVRVDAFRPSLVPYGSKTPRSEVGRHERHIVVDDKGIAEIRVRLEQVQLNGTDLVLARPTPGFNQLEPQARPAVAYRNTTKMSLPPAVICDPEAQSACYLKSDPNAFDSLEWKYEMSNAYALDRADAELARLRSRNLVRLDPGEDAYIYQVQFPSRELDLKVDLTGASVAPTDVCVVAQYQAETATCEVEWKDDTEETRRLKVGCENIPACREPPTPARQRLHLSVPHPLLGRRYGFQYKLGDAGRPTLPANVAKALDAVISECRCHLPCQGDLLQLLTNDVNATAAGLLLGMKEANADERRKVMGSWIAHLWSNRRRELVPAFGQCPPEIWESTFAYGEGVAGHAFRIRGPAVYHHVAADDARAADARTRRTRLLYRPARYHGGDLGGHLWIVVVPLLLYLDGPTVGTVSFARREKEPLDVESHARLAQMAEGIVMEWDKSGAERQQLETLMQLLSLVFWQDLAPKYGWANGVYRDSWSNVSQPSAT